MVRDPGALMCFNGFVLTSETLSPQRGAHFSDILGSRSSSLLRCLELTFRAARPQNYGKTRRFAQFVPAKTAKGHISVLQHLPSRKLGFLNLLQQTKQAFILCRLRCRTQNDIFWTEKIEALSICQSNHQTSMVCFPPRTSYIADQNMEVRTV